jgi:hypothetical protein
MEISVELPQQTKNRPTIDPAIPLPGTYLKESKSAYERDTCTPVFAATALVTIAKL